VIANSDSPEDQALKLQVRDRLLLTFGETFREVRSMEEARGIIQANLAALEQTACVEIENQGFSYPVEAKLGIYPFPTRVYGDLVYPAGNYEALRVVIGEGKGANWWCVMFPPLCFVDVSSGAAKQPQQENPKEADLSSPSIGEENTIVYTFKAAQLWKSFREWIGSF
jgi:stage II sporulation protein R